MTLKMKKSVLIGTGHSAQEFACGEDYIQKVFNARTRQSLIEREV
jgi:hypothetical protein